MPNSLERVIAGELLNPDGYMRLVRIREALDHGHWFGNIVSGGDSGAGTLIYWSHFFDFFILLLSAPLTLVLPAPEALFWAAAISTPICAGILGSVLAWASAPLVSPSWRWLIALAPIFSVPILNYGQIGMASHHIPILVLVAACWGSGGRAILVGSHWGFMAGWFAGLALWLSPESMPFCMMAFIGIYLSWVIQPTSSISKVLVQFGFAFFITIATGLLVDPPHAGFFSTALDRISINFLVLAIVVLIQSAIPLFLENRIPLISIRISVALLVGVLGAGLWLLLFPNFLLGLDGLMTPEQAVAFFVTAEMKGVDSLKLFFAYGTYGVLLLGSCIYMVLASHERLTKIFWLYIATCSIFISSLAFMHLRFSIYSAAGSVMMLGVVISTIDQSALKRFGFLVRPAMIGLFLLLPIVLSAAFTPKLQSDVGIVRKAQEVQCRLMDVSPYLMPYKGKVVLAGVNEGPELLYRAPVKIVGGLYHAGIGGFMRLKESWGSRDLEEIPAPLKSAGVQFILLCPGPLRSAIVGGDKNTLFDRLNQGSPPPWLTLVDIPEAPHWRLYKVD